MINYYKLIINIGISKIFLLLGLLCCSGARAENTNAEANNLPITSPEMIAQTNTQLHARGFSSAQINQMVDELQQLLNRVESTVISVEAKQNSSNSTMSDVVNQIIRNGYRASFVSNNSSTHNYSNTRANRAIANAKQLLNQFPLLAQQDFALARRMWLDARRDLWMSYPVNDHLAQPEIRAIWLDRGTIVKARSKKDLEPLFDRMARAGINTVFMETVNASYPIYPSRVAPEQNPMTKGWDPLQASIELAHERGMELHAWLWAFAAANQGHNAILGQPKHYLGPVLARYPDWVLKDRNGHVFNRTPGFKKAFFDPANPEVRRYLKALINEVVTKYDVDGIQLDYIRYPFQDNTTKQYFGYTNISRSLFKQRYGVDPRQIRPSSYAWGTWTGFKIRQVTSFVEEVSELIKSKNPDLILSTAVFPMEKRRRLNTLQQHWEDWSYNKSVDMIVLMTYALDTGSFEDRIKLVYDNNGQNPNFIIPAIRLLNVPETEAFDKMQLIRSTPSGGYALFAAENFDRSLENIFKQTQGSQGKDKEPIPYRQPFVSAVFRYQALQREWIYLLQNQQLKIDSTYLQQWSEESDELAANLQQLAQNPTMGNVVAVERQLSSYKLRLSRYLSQHQQDNSWQVDAWMNRLITVENILQYGKNMLASNNTSALQLSDK